MIVAANRLAPSRQSSHLSPAVQAFVSACKLYGPARSDANTIGKAARALDHATGSLATLTHQQRLGFLEQIQDQIETLQIRDAARIREGRKISQPARR